MKYDIQFTNQFKKDLKLAKKREYPKVCVNLQTDVR